MKPSSWKQEWSAVLIISFLTAILLALPYIIGHLTAREGSVYTGLLVNLEDGTYLFAIEQGRMGAWLYQSPFTVEQHEPVFLEGFYLMLGQAARLFGLSSITMWHIGLFVGNLALFLTIYGFIILFLTSLQKRLTAFLLALFGAGFDWWSFPDWFEIQAAFEVVPIDFRFPEAHIFYSALTFPHFVAGITFILLVFGLTLKMLFLPAGDNRRWLLAAGAGFANLLLGIVYPFMIFLTVAVLGGYYLYYLWQGRHSRQVVPWLQRIDWRELGEMGLIFLIPLPLFLYYVFVFFNNPALQRWSDQAYTPSPNPVHYLLTYGLYIVLGILYLLKQRGMFNSLTKVSVEKGQDNVDTNSPARLLKQKFLWVWVGIAAILLYLPLNSQRRYVEGLHVPLSILATMGFFAVVWPWMMRSRLLTALLKRPRYSAAGMQKLMILALIAVVGLANVYLYSSTLIKLGLQQPYPLFRPQAEMEAMAWLRERVDPDDVVLATYQTGSFLPYQTGATVIVGNRYETGDFERKRQAAAQFFMPETSDQWRRNLLIQDNVQYVFVGREEQKIGGGNLSTVDYLEPIYQNREVIIYTVQDIQSSSE